MRVNDYSQAVHELIQSGVSIDDAFHGLTTVLAKRGHERLYPKILRDLMHESEKHLTDDTITVTVAQEEDAKTLKEHIAEAVRALGSTETVVVVDPTITGGFIAAHKEKRIDASYKKKLLTLYRSLIA